MKQLLFLCLVFSGMLGNGGLKEKVRLEAEIKCLESLASFYANLTTNVDPAQAVIESAALALDVSVEEVKKLARLDVAEIVELCYRCQGNSLTYIATLKNGDTVCADFFVKGPAKGRYDSTRIILKDGFSVMVPMGAEVYHVLAELYAKGHKVVD